MTERGYVTDPKTWANAIITVGPQYAVIFALIAILAFLAFKGVPAIIALTEAIDRNSDQITGVAKAEEYNQSVIVQNQTKIINNESDMIDQHGKILSLMANRETVLNLEEQTCLNTAKSEYQQRKCMEIRSSGLP